MRVFGEPALGAKDCGEVLLPGKRFGVREILKPAGSGIVFLRLADRTAAAWVARECPPPKDGAAANAPNITLCRPLSAEVDPPSSFVSSLSSL